MAEKTTENKNGAGDQNYDTYQLIVFKQGQEEYALHIDQIKEVVITPNITKMPQSASYIKGVANIRGNIIAILDLEERFGLSKSNVEAVNSSKNYTLVIESEDFKVGILVKEVPNTLAINANEIDENVNIVQDANVEQNYIKGIVKVKNRLIILIDIFKVMTLNEVHSAMGKTVNV